MKLLHTLNNMLDNFLDYLLPIDNTMSPECAAYIIQLAYRKHLIRKYFKSLKKQTAPYEHKTGWFY